MNTATKKKITIMLDAEVYAGLQEKVGGRKIGAFLSKIARPFVVEDYIESGYKAMAQDSVREGEVSEWIEDAELVDSEKEEVWQF